jgi:hypothetical protein
VLVLGRHENLNQPVVLAMVDLDFDLHQPTEVLQQLLGLVVEIVQLRLRQAAVAGRYRDLHPDHSFPIIPPARNLNLG